MDKQLNSTTVPTVSIGGIHITTDSEGRFNLNALHKASGAEKKDGPTYWLALESTKALIAELDKQTTEISVVAIEGRNGGTFAHELLAISYAGWISPVFQLQVNQAFIDVRSGKVNVMNLPIVPRIKMIGDTFAGLKRLAVTAGFRGNMAVISAAQATNKAIGINPLTLIDATHLEADMQEQFVTPTQISDRTDPTSSAQKVNKVLVAIGFQIEHRRTVKGKEQHDYWELTSAGEKAGGDYFDVGKKKGDGTPVKQIKWPVSVITSVQAELSK
jgi:hypothetical protein